MTSARCVALVLVLLGRLPNFVILQAIRTSPDEPDVAIARRNGASKGPGNFVRIGRTAAGAVDVVDQMMAEMQPSDFGEDPQQPVHQQRIFLDSAAISSELRRCVAPLFRNGLLTGTRADFNRCLAQSMLQQQQIAGDAVEEKRTGGAAATAGQHNGKFVRIGRRESPSPAIGGKRKRSSRENRFVRIGRQLG